jgi:ATP-dependent Lon protease
MSAESTVSRNYLDWLLAVPWKKRSKETRSIDTAEKVLDTDHYGLEKIKDRILEFLAVVRAAWTEFRDGSRAIPIVPGVRRSLRGLSRRLRTSAAAAWHDLSPGAVSR